MPGTLLQQFRERGYAMVPGFKSPDQIMAIRTRARELAQDFDTSGQQAVFSTQEQQRRVNDYFLGSAETIRCFLEEEAVDTQGRLQRDKSLSINKIGHALHDLDPVFERFSHGPELDAAARAVGLAHPLVWQSMFIFKQPGIGGEVRWHQDASFFVTTPVSVTTFWFALEDAHQGNGCLWVQPGGHCGPLRERFVRTGDTAVIEPLDDTPWPELRDAIPLEVCAGTLVMFHGLLPHYSGPNRSVQSRHAYTLHATDARTLYAPGNWLQRRADFAPRGFV
jgi:phytanoyl-CoA hydroxylase